jgi:hypothetical protein
VGAQRLQVLPEGDIPIVGDPCHTQCRVKFAVLVVCCKTHVSRPRHGGGCGGAVRHVRAQGGQAVRLARIVVHGPVGDVEQSIQAVRVQQACCAQELRPLIERRQSQ